MFLGIEASAGWDSVTPVEKGWSSDRKYRIVTGSGEKLLLRVFDEDQYEVKKKEFGIIESYSRLGFPMNHPLDFGFCGGGKAYMLLTWLEGVDLEDVLPELPEETQYRLGREAGRILKRIHSIPVRPEDAPEETKKAKKLRQLARYESSDLRYPGDENALRYVKENIDRIWTCAPVYQHGDFHPGNLIYGENGSLGVIDFNRWEVGDPWEEFYKLESFGSEISIPYCVGQIDAYFGEAVPDDFWKALAVYVAHASLYSIKWAEPFGQAEVDGMVRRCRAAFEHFDGFRSYIPNWYSDEYRRRYQK